MFALYLAFILFFLQQNTLTAAAYVEELRDGSTLSCDPYKCDETIFCWRGARYSDLSQIHQRLVVTLTFKSEEDACVYYETDDHISLRDAISGESAAMRLSKREGSSLSWISSFLVSILFRDSTFSSSSRMCHGNTCSVPFSPFSLSCIRPCPSRNEKKPALIQITSYLEPIFDRTSIYYFALGALLFHFAPMLSESREMFYITGGSIGAICAVLAVVLIWFYARTGSRPTAAHLGLGVFLQAGAYHSATILINFFDEYVAYLGIFTITMFFATIGMIHYSFTDDRGKFRIHTSIHDIARTTLKLLGSFIFVMPIASPRYRAAIMVIVIFLQFAYHLRNGEDNYTKKSRDSSDMDVVEHSESEASAFSDSGDSIESEGSLGSDESENEEEFDGTQGSDDIELVGILDFIRTNHDKIMVARYKT